MASSSKLGLIDHYDCFTHISGYLQFDWWPFSLSSCANLVGYSDFSKQTIGVNQIVPCTSNLVQSFSIDCKTIICSEMNLDVFLWFPGKVNNRFLYGQACPFYLRWYQEHRHPQMKHQFWSFSTSTCDIFSCAMTSSSKSGNFDHYIWFRYISRNLHFDWRFFEMSLCAYFVWCCDLSKPRIGDKHVVPAMSNMVQLSHGLKKYKHTQKLTWPWPVDIWEGQKLGFVMDRQVHAL